MTGKTSRTYLIHADRPHGHAQHYIGSTDDLDERIKQHQATTWERFAAPIMVDGHPKNGATTGPGATLMGVFNAYGISWQVVRTWKGGRKVERALKNQRHHRLLCPVCNPKALNRARKVKV